MTRRTLTTGLAGVALLSVLAISAVSGAWGGPAAQTDATAQQQTIDALVNERFQQTQAAQQVLGQTQTAEAAGALGPAQTAAFEATVNAAFNNAQTATAEAALAQSAAAQGRALITPANASQLAPIGSVGQGSVNAAPVAFGPQGAALLTLDGQGGLRLWNLFSGAEMARFEGLAGDVSAAALSPDGRWAAAAAGPQIRVWDATGGGQVSVIDAGVPVRRLAFQPDGVWLAAGLEDGSLLVFDAPSGELVLQVPGPAAPVKALAFSATQLAAGGDDGVRLVDLDNGAPAPFGDASGVRALAFSAGGSLLAATQADGSLIVWDMASGAEQWRAAVPGAAEAPLSAAFGPTGLLAVGGSERAALTLYDGRSGAQAAAVGEAAPAPGVAFSPDGSLIATAGAPVTLWAVALTGQAQTASATPPAAAAAPTAASGPLASATPRPENFPTNTIATVQIAEQLFEHGRMFWVRHNRQIWVMVDVPDPTFPGGDWFCYNDTFVEGEPETDPSLTPPEGLYQPRRGFGKLWRTHPDLKAALGWAMTPEFELNSNYTYIPGGYVDANGTYVPGAGEHRLTTLYGESISFFEQDIRGDCLGGTWRQTK